MTDDTQSMIEEIYNQYEPDIPLETFAERAREKNEALGEYVSIDAAATLVAEDLADDRATPDTIAEASPGHDDIELTGTITDIGSITDTEHSKVVNVRFDDGTAAARAAFWGPHADTAVETLSVGDDIAVTGSTSDAYFDGDCVDINASEFELIESGADEAAADSTASESDPATLAAVSAPMQRVTVSAVALAVGDQSTFIRDDGSQGQVCDAVLVDESGYRPLVCWDDASAALAAVDTGTAVTCTALSPRRDKYGSLSLHSTDETSINAADDIDITFTPDTTPLDELPDPVADGDPPVISTFGRVTSIQSVTEFDRDDGSTGAVRNLTLEDAHGSVDLVCWGEQAYTSLETDEPVLILDGEVKAGDEQYGGGTELHVGSQAVTIPSPPADIVTIDHALVAQQARTTEMGDGQETDTAGDTPTDDGEPLEATEIDTSSVTEQTETADSEPAERTGTVFEVGDDRMLTLVTDDDTKETFSIPDSESLPAIGSTVTVRLEPDTETVTEIIG